jgi:hypothetical protein
MQLKLGVFSFFSLFCENMLKITLFLTFKSNLRHVPVKGGNCSTHQIVALNLFFQMVCVRTAPNGANLVETLLF